MLEWDSTAFPPANTRQDDRWPETPWEATHARHGWNGNGHLLYPGPDMQPIPSLRLEIWRQGIEDYLYLWLLRERLEAADADDDLRRQARNALSVPLVRGVTDYVSDPAELEAERARIASLIMDLSDQ
jgi:hypothetical protein